MPSDPIPLIPLSLPRPALISAIRTACLTHGFFQITDCPPPPRPLSTCALQTTLLHHAQTFFSLTRTQKLRLKKNNHIHGGYESYQQYSLQADRGAPDLHEGFSIAPAFVDADDERIGREAWPEESEENGLVGFREICRAYYAYVEGLARIVAGLIAEGLGLEREYFGAYFERQMAHCRLIHYFSDSEEGDRGEKEGEKKNDIGIGLHTDWGLITVLLQDDVGGLQVLDSKTGGYIPVPPTPGAYVVNCGDLLSRFTNGVYTSARHRVIAPPSGVHRYSVPFFCDGNPDYVVDVLPLGEEWKAWVQGKRGKPVEVERRVYEPVRAGDYFEMKWRESASGGKK